MSLPGGSLKFASVAESTRKRLLLANRVSSALHRSGMAFADPLSLAMHIARSYT
jgi:hypothetical protein